MIGRKLAAVAAALIWGLNSAMAFDAQGHRGARGLVPENTLSAFARALSIGVTTLELDIGLTKDNQVVVSHDPVLKSHIVRDAKGAWIADPGPRLSDLTISDLKTYNVGAIKPDSKYAERFADQEQLAVARIPALAEVFDLVEAAGNKSVRFNIETKLNPTRPELTADPRQMAKALVDLVVQRGLGGRVTIQSFDWRSLQLVQQAAPQIATAYLTAQQRWLNNIAAEDGALSPWTAGFNIDDVEGSVPRLVHAAGGRIWSPFFRDLTDEDLAAAHELGLQVVVWTVNKPVDMAALLDRGVDGIITDYPDRLRQVMESRGMPLPDPTPIEAAEQ